VYLLLAGSYEGVRRPACYFVEVLLAKKTIQIHAQLGDALTRRVQDLFLLVASQLDRKFVFSHGVTPLGAPASGNSAKCDILTPDTPSSGISVLTSRMGTVIHPEFFRLKKIDFVAALQTSA
jgi:hypothetical protein